MSERFKLKRHASDRGRVRKEEEEEEEDRRVSLMKAMVCGFAMMNFKECHNRPTMQGWHMQREAYTEA